MLTYLKHQKKNLLFSTCTRLIVIVLSFSLVFSPAASYAQSINLLNLPVPGTMVPPSPAFVPVLLKGMTIHPENPLQFDFIVDSGNTHLQGQALRKEASKLFKYFLAALTVPEEELWVNLSPYEKERVIPQGFGDTEMGRDLLAQDYLLKQLTASLMYPEKELGKKFWDKVYKKAYEQYGTTEVPMNTFNKVWIVPEKAVIYEQGASAFVVDAHLKVMLEQDYVASQHNLAETPAPLFPEGKQQGLEEDYVAMSHQSSTISPQPSDQKLTTEDRRLTTQIVREIILPEIEKEVNEGKTFANLRQIYTASILAAWYKMNLKTSLLGQVYADQNKTKGVDTQDKEANQKIYSQYLEAFKKGVYNYIKEDIDPATQEIIPRKYFSGGVSLALKEKDATNLGVKGRTSILRRTAKGVLSWILAGSLAGMPAVDAEVMVAKGLRPNAAEAKAYQFGVNIVGIGPKADEDYITTVSDGTLVNPLRTELQGQEKRMAVPVANYSVGEIELARATLRGDIFKVKSLLDQGVDVNAKTVNGMTALMIATRQGHLKIVEELLKRGADVNAQNDLGTTALMLAALFGQENIATILLLNGAKPIIQDSAGASALWVASNRGYINIAKSILFYQKDVDLKGPLGSTALIAATAGGHVDIVKVLIDYGADANAKTDDETTALFESAQNGYLPIVQVLVQAGARINERLIKGRTALMQASQNRHYDVVKFLLDNGADVNIKAKDGVTALIIAAGKGYPEIAQLLLEKGADVNIKADKGITALMLAVENGYDVIVKMLLEAGADVNASHENGMTALHLASQQEHTKIVRMLLVEGAKIDLQDTNGATALIIASQNGYLEIVKELLDRRANLDLQASNGATALILASEMGHTNIVKALISVGSNVNMTNTNDEEALFIASFKGYYDIVSILLESGAQINRENIVGFIPLHMAAQEGHNDVLSLLLLKGANVNARSEEGETPLFVASRNRKYEIIKTLLKHKADVNIQNNFGFNPLMVATYVGSLEIVEILLKNGANVHAKNQMGLTALDIAEIKGFPEIIRLLKKAGAKGQSRKMPFNDFGSTNVALGKNYTASSPIKLPESWAKRVAMTSLVAALGICTGAGCGPSFDNQQISELDVRAILLRLTDHQPQNVIDREEYREIIRRGESTVPILKQVLYDSTAETDARKWAVRLLGEVGAFDTVFPVLVNVIENKDSSFETWHREEAWNGLVILFRRQSDPFGIASKILQSDDVLVKQLTLRMLKWLDPPEAIETIFKFVKEEENVDLRVEAVEQLEVIANTRTIDPLIYILKNDPNVLVRVYAAEALGAFKDSRAVDPLIEALLTDPGVRGRAAHALGNIREKRAVGPLIEILSTDSSARYWVTKALGEIGDMAAVDPLIQALEDTSFAVRGNAAEALGILKAVSAVDPLIQILLSTDDPIKATVAEALGKIGDIRAEDALLENFNSSDNFSRTSFARALGMIKSVKAVPHLLGVLASTDSSDVEDGTFTLPAIIVALGEIGDAEAAFPLIQRFNVESEWSIKRIILAALAKIPDPIAVNFAIKTLFNETYLTPRIYFTELNGVENVLFLDSLSNILFNGTDEKQKNAAAEYLGQTKSLKAVDSLIQALRTGSESIRIGAAQGLGEIGDAKAMEVLIQTFLSDTSEPVLEDIAIAFADIGDARAIDPLIQVLNTNPSSSLLRDAIAYALGKLKAAKAVPSLIKVALNDPESFPQFSAIHALVEIGDSRALNPLIQILHNAPSDFIRQTVAIALGDLKNENAVPDLTIARENDPKFHVRYYSNIAILEVYHVYPNITFYESFFEISGLARNVGASSPIKMKSLVASVLAPLFLIANFGQEPILDFKSDTPQGSAEQQVILVGSRVDILLFTKAAFEGDIGIVRRYLREGIDVNVRSLDLQVTALILASMQGHSDIVEILLTYGADINLTDINGNSALQHAVYQRRTSIVEILLKNGANTNLKEKFGGITPLMTAAMNGDYRIVELLIGNDANVNAKTIDGITALMSAAIEGHDRVVEILIKHGAEVNAKTEGGATALDFAEEKGNLNIIRMLKAAGAKRGAGRSPVRTLPAHEKDVGGIDLNPALLDLQIKTDGNGVPLPLPQQPIGEMHIEGFIPVIIHVIPIPNLPLLLGLDDTEGGKKDLSHTPGLGPMESKKRFEFKDFDQIGLLN